MARSSWKFKYFSRFVWKQIVLLKKKKSFKKFYKIDRFYERASVIPNCFKKKTLFIHKGFGFRKFLINSYSIGFKFGEFSFSRKPYHFPIKKSKKVRK